MIASICFNKLKIIGDVVKKTLVTGGAGFIGSHLVDRLLCDGHHVIVLDNFSTGRPQNLEQHKENQFLTLLNVDISEYDTIVEHFKEVDWVFHLAALADIVPSIKSPFEYHRSNVDGTISVLEASRFHGIKRFVYAASSSCYGIPDRYPTQETAELRPQYPYALTKSVGEQYVMHWGQAYRLPVVSLRMFNVYGPRSRTAGTYGAVFGVFLAQKLGNQPYTVVGNGKQTRDFTFVTDIIEAYVKVAESDVCNEIFNLGSGNTYSIKRLVELLGGDVTYIPKRPGEPDCTFADVSKICNILGWKANTSFEQGVQIMLDNIEYWRQAPVWTPEKIKQATKEWFQYLG
ncbi:MAG: NAD-dependent dehydratase [Desulfobacula sp. RIFOXYA12_FULL_46_16]|nr:MAG: NAD-dependent dehydratase [Desulfobacula sp. RIFOXYA12_FULL_46_16]